MGYDPHHPEYVSVPIPMWLKAGLDELAELTQLKVLWFWGGRHAFYKRKLEWMVDRWKQLEAVGGSWMIAGRPWYPKLVYI